MALEYRQLEANLSANAGTAQEASGTTIETFLGSLGAAAGFFGAQILLFYLLRLKLARIYQPRTYLAAEKNRTKPPPAGFFAWVLPLFQTSNAELISKCGLDSYFFLRYLRMLLKIFIPLSCLTLPILLPINSDYKKGSAKGLDKLGWNNYDPERTHRFWAHLLLAIVVLLWAFYIIHDELRGYIRVRQAYLTSPQHRLRASATTVLVTSIPRKWLTFEALDGLYDVFPGGIRNIWINRNFDELARKINQRDKLATMLENAETALVRKAMAKHQEMQEKEAKKAGEKRSKQDKEKERTRKDGEAAQMAAGPGMSAGNPHQAHTLDEELGQTSDFDSDREGAGPQKSKIPILGQGLGIIGDGLGTVGQGFTKFGKDVFGLPKRMEKKFDAATEGATFANLDGTDERGPAAPARDSQEVPLRSNPQGEPMRSPSTKWSNSTPPQNRVQNSQPAVEDFANEPTWNRKQEQTLSSQGRNDEEFGYRNERPTFEFTRPSTATESAARPSGENRGRLRGRHWSQEGYMTSARGRGWKFWQDSSHNMRLPSPEPKAVELSDLTYKKDASAGTQRGKDSESSSENAGKSKFLGLFSRNKDEEYPEEEYPSAYDEAFDHDQGDDTEPVWKKYLSEGDRDTKRLPPFNKPWLPFLPSWTFIGKKVDVIYHCRKEVARLNLEIEQDQQEPQKYPLMNSAFIQFNHQVAAHMACQSLSHHVPNHMAPRIVEISPDDVLWENMSIKWWERFLRIGIISALVAGLVIAWAVPVSVSASISNLSYLEQYTPFAWISKLPKWITSALQGVLPWAMLQLLLALLPVLLRFAAQQQGVHTGMAVELSVQGYYFAFLFVQLFLVVTISSSIFKVLGKITNNPADASRILAENIPRAGNYFFSYMLLQALSTSAGQLVQAAQLFVWFIWRRMADNSARQKFRRQTTFTRIRWGTFFPVYTNLACIGLVYSVISPLVMVFNIITFSLFWVAYRYQILYVNWSRFDTGGLLFPKAINQLFTGIYVMELALIGLFFLIEDSNKKQVCAAQAIVMVVVLLFTVLYHFLLNWTYSPLYRYMPITLEDDAVRRDEEFARAQSHRWGLTGPEHDNEDIEHELERREQNEEDYERMAEEQEAKDIRERRQSGHAATAFRRLGNIRPSRAMLAPGAWSDRSRQNRALHVESSPHPHPPPSPHRHHRHHRRSANPNDNRGPAGNDVEKGGDGDDQAIGDVLFGSFNDEIEDLSPAERDKLVQRAFLHKALRARRPAIWIPRDELGVSDDEIRRTQRFSDKIWISNEFTGLDQKGRVLFSRAPPDFSEVDLIDL